MAIIPKRLAFKLCFRKKTNTRKLIYRERKLPKLSKNTNNVFLPSFDYRTTSKSFDLVPINRQLSKQYNFAFPLLPLLLPLAFGLQTKQGQKAQMQGAFKKAKGKDQAISPDLFTSHCGNHVQLLKRSNVWPINSNHVYLKTQTNCSVNSKSLLFGLYGICVVQHATISAAYVDTIKLDIAKILKKRGRVWTRICCDCPVSARPAETRMGKGKGSISYWVARVRPGQLLFEFSGITKGQLDEIFQKLCKKTSIGLNIIS